MAGVTAGTCMAATSMGVTTRLLSDSRALGTEMGNLVLVSAMADDVFSLVALAVITHLGHHEQLSKRGQPGRGGAAAAWTIVRPVIASSAVLLLGGALIFFVPWVAGKWHACGVHGNHCLLRCCSPRVRQSLLLVVLFTIAFGAAAAAGYAEGSHLLAIFCAGMAFSTLADVKVAWHTYVDAPATWIASLFFLSIGTSIPVSELFSWHAIGYGFLFTIPAVLSKWLSGMFVMCGQGLEGGGADSPGKRFLDWNVVGWAMVGRGELGLMIATIAVEHELIDHNVHAIVVWSILMSTLASPLIFGLLLRRREASTRAAAEEAAKRRGERGDVSKIVVKT